MTTRAMSMGTSDFVNSRNVELKPPYNQELGLYDGHDMIYIRTYDHMDIYVTTNEGNK